MLKQLYFGILLVLSLIACSNTGNQTLSVTVKNETASEITLTAFSEKIQNAVPIQVNSLAQCVLNSDSFGDIDFTVSFHGKKYTGNTGYADDYRSYTIVFSENSDGYIECNFITNNIKRPIDLLESQ
jgi:hypothetical protein